MLYLVIGVGFFIYVLYSFSKIPLAIKLNQRGVTTTGKVLDMWVIGSRNRAYYIAYEFGVGQRARESVNGEDWHRLGRGSTVTIRYLTENPTVSRLELTQEDLEDTKDEIKSPGSKQAAMGAAARGGLIAGGFFGAIFGLIIYGISILVLRLIQAPQEQVNMLVEYWYLVPLFFGIAGGLVLSFKWTSRAQESFEE